VDASGKPLHSWRTLILPYLGEEQLHHQIDLAKPWNDPVNAAAFATMPSVYHCPAGNDARGTTAYLAVVALDGFLVPGRSRRFAEITDGLGSTLAVIEASEESAIPWMAPFDADANLFMNLDQHAKLHHAGGTNVVLGDGSVRFLRVDTPAPARRALLSISGNDNDALKEW
jgi:prepilin-type processing-associated H-X9-DG protein